MSRKQKRDAIPRNSRQVELRETALAVAALSRREHLPLSIAARIEGIRPSTVLRYAGSAFEKHGKDYRAKAADRIARTLTILDSKSKRPATVHTSQAASLISRYWHAVRKATTTNDYSGLKRFKGKKVPYSSFNFLVSPAKLKKFADAGILDFEHFYWRGRVL